MGKEFHKLPEFPKQDGEYLIIVSIFGNPRYKVESFAKNLYDIDNYDFYKCKNKPGFYKLDSEYGYYEIDDVIAWAELPEIPKEFYI